MTEPVEHYLSPTAFERLQREHEKLVNAGRKEVTEQIRVAREHGDLSENADYSAAKDRQGLMEARIRELESILRNARILKGGDDTPSIVTPGKIVTILRESTGDQEVYLVGSAENRGLGYDIVSPTSTLGSALIGRGVGETVNYDAPVGKLSVKVVEVRPLES